MDNDLIFDHEPTLEEVLEFAGFKAYYNLCAIKGLPPFNSLEEKGYKFVWYSVSTSPNRGRRSPLYLPKRDYEIL